MTFWSGLCVYHCPRGSSGQKIIIICKINKLFCQDFQRHHHSSANRFAMTQRLLNSLSYVLCYDNVCSVLQHYICSLCELQQCVFCVATPCITFVCYNKCPILTAFYASKSLHPPKTFSHSSNYNEILINQGGKQNMLFSLYSLLCAFSMN